MNNCAFAMGCLMAGMLGTAYGVEYRTYIIAGQSNAQGYGYASGTEIRNVLKPNTNLAELGREDLLKPDSDIRIFLGAVGSGKGEWKALSPGCGIQWDGVRFGPELSFGHALRKEGDGRIALIKYAKGGTSLAERTDGKPDADDWNLHDDVENQYDFFVKTLHNAIAAAEERGDTLKIQGLLWMQGEADARSAEHARAYEENLKAFIASVRRELELPRLKFYLGSIADSPAWKDREAIWSAQESAASADPDVFVVNGKDLPLFENDGDNCANIHYTTASQVLLGERFAEAVLSGEKK
jgi:hypothetical protein